jgi:hypothetical protein
MRMNETTHSGAAQHITAPVSNASAPHYTWARICDGWRLVDTPGLSVIEERVPPGAGEVRHYHNQARQFVCFQARLVWKRKEASTEFQLVPGLKLLQVSSTNS